MRCILLILDGIGDRGQDCFDGKTPLHVELFLPLRHVGLGKKIESIIGMPWDEGQQQLECVLSKNYQERDNSVILNEDAVKRFLDEFAFKKTEEVIKGYLETIC